MDKKVFFNQDGVTVSKTRFIVHGQLYEINKISALRYKKLLPNLLPAILCFSAGLLLASQEDQWFAFGGCFILLGIIVGFAAKPRHAIILDMPAGTTKALVSTDKPHVERVIQAIYASMGKPMDVKMMEQASAENSPSFT